ncbi:YbhB/YbcL family Raf kinase inhibitor-like protein [Methanolobus bombayensis]|uniref:YbhB/YbcL family Raf kinase inhibitor-like protein n=1 Tax=Methanolobus bombayensis TaxID=38023 RepID=UPI001FD848FC|nr:YbhB/YbcL family Raf kinase inhibitor-like protein [Methanolobus bombayensis]MBP1909390.1 Raf kinase inhibitor-like YbhB/YbcL family protein [Methanolobus bombayensis]
MISDPLVATMNFKHVKSILLVLMVLLLSLSLSGCLGADEVQEKKTDILSGSAEDIENGSNVNPEDDNMLSETLIVTSSAFENNGAIPVKYTCDGENINPALEVKGIPSEAVSLLLIMDDPDAPMVTFTHWVVWNIATDPQIDENSIPGVEGKNSADQVSYIGPCPPSGTHRYFFKVYALDAELDLESGSERDIVEDSMDGHVVAYGELMGTYSRA